MEVILLSVHGTHVEQLLYSMSTFDSVRFIKHSKQGREGVNNRA